MSMRSGSRVSRQVSAAGSVVFAVCLALAPGLGRAALKTKANAGTDLTSAGSWDALPGSGDVAAWTNTSLCAGLTLPGNVSWGGLLVAGALTDIDITGSGTLTSGASGIDLSASAVSLSLGTSVALAANQTWSVTNNRTLAVSGSVGGAFGLTKAGGGAVALTGSNNTWSGNTLVNAGTLNLGGGFGGAIGMIGSSVLGVGFAGGTTGAVAVIGGGTFAATKLMVGYTGGSGNITQGNGWLIVTNGTINVTNTANYFVIGGEEANPANGTLGVGQVDLSGNGTINFSPKTASDIEMGTRGGRGVLNVGGNAMLTGNHLQLGLGSGLVSTNARVYVTQSGGTVALSDNSGLLFMNTKSGAWTVYNLNGGVLNAKMITCGTGLFGSIFNFNGGTLKAGASSANFMGGLNSAVIYAGGATIDDGGFSITNSQALVAPTLYGLGPVGSTFAPTTPGSGYTTPPNVTFSAPSGGTPATGCAELNADGTIKDIVITSPGCGYSKDQSVTVALVGGGGGTGAVFAGLAASVPNSSGCLTKAGNGVLTLIGASTYTGGTTNNAGVLRLGSASALPGGQALTINGGMVDMQNCDIAIGSLSGMGGNVAVGGRLTVTQSVDATYGGVFAGTGTVVKAGTASLTLGGSKNTIGAIVIAGGTLKLQRNRPVAARDWNAAGLAGTNGSAVGAWADTVSGRYATTYGSAPTLVTGDSALGGRPAVNFNGSGQALKVLAADSSINTNAGCNVNAFTLAVVFKPTANGGTGANRAEWWNGSGIVSSEQAGNTTDWALVYNADTVQAGLGQGTGGADTGLLASNGSALNTGHVAIYSWNKATGTIILNVDGTTTATNNATTARGVYDFAIGRNSPGGYGNYFQGNIAEIQFFTNGLTGAEIDNVGYALAQTYGVSTTYANNRDANLSADAALSIAAGGTLDLNGMRQTARQVQGGGTISNGTLTVAGTLAPGGLQTVGALAVENLGLSENATYDWNYGDAASDTVLVTGTLTLPTVATVGVSRVAGATAALADRSVLFTCPSGAISAGDLSGWTVEGAQTGTHVKVSGNQVVLVLPRGTLIRVQ